MNKNIISDFYEIEKRLMGEIISVMGRNNRTEIDFRECFDGYLEKAGENNAVWTFAHTSGDMDTQESAVIVKINVRTYPNTDYKDLTATAVLAYDDETECETIYVFSANELAEILENLYDFFGE